MNITNSSNSNYSGTSSETSETLSIDDINQNSFSKSTVTSNLNSRIPKSWNRMSNSNNEKDGESKRPPWRAVSVSTLPKPDKSAILRAKLLDASRRLRAAKASVATQTDYEPNKLMKEVNLGVQSDLVIRKDASIVTDGCYAKKKEGTDEFVLTYSVSQVTDAIAAANASTQTLLPKIPADEFMECYLRGGECVIDTEKFTDTQRKLLQQITEIRRRDGQCINRASRNAKFWNKERLGVSPSSLFQPTLASWNFGYDEIGSEMEQKYVPYIIYPSDTLNTTHDGRVQFKNLLNAIEDILKESYKLVEVIDNMKLG